MIIVVKIFVLKLFKKGHDKNGLTIKFLRQVLAIKICLFHQHRS